MKPASTRMPNCGNALSGNEHTPAFEKSPLNISHGLKKSFIFLLVVSDILVKANYLRMRVGEIS
jgi:hypothetical protein